VVDVNKDGFSDVVAVGEWMSPAILYNQNGKLSPGTTLPASVPLNGWWNRVVADDLDGDGDLDFVLGNLGLNGPMKASPKEPVTLDYADFDGNGTIDPIMSYFTGGVSYPAVGRDEALEQVVILRKKFTSYESFSKATINDFFPPQQLKAAHHLRVDFTETVVLENTGTAFAVHPLPVQAQYSPVHAIATGDFNGDGEKDILLCGNNSTYRLRIGKMDANHGVLLTGNGSFQYQYVPQSLSGFRLRGDVKDIQHVNNNALIFFTNNGPVRMYSPTKTGNLAAAKSSSLK
jgi:hypothetical protein